MVDYVKVQFSKVHSVQALFRKCTYIYQIDSECSFGDVSEMCQGQLYQFHGEELLLFRQQPVISIKILCFQ